MVVSNLAKVNGKIFFVSKRELGFKDKNPKSVAISSRYRKPSELRLGFNDHFSISMRHFLPWATADGAFEAKGGTSTIPTSGPAKFEPTG